MQNWTNHSTALYCYKNKEHTLKWKQCFQPNPYIAKAVAFGVPGDKYGEKR